MNVAEYHFDEQYVSLPMADSTNSWLAQLAVDKTVMLLLGPCLLVSSAFQSFI